ncbi:C40 family peptidase [Allokutzneria albata]|uniref:Cell wall-associated hydrolase, NlpC family n=1 Tax=Allokutzneria albata TaxID=211114 RepID=A0A1G9Y952_ALLAB|nr:bifunctional lytic transglycosylase/C40 family peptidase [Allokutzneria albata]SDN05632.1 Cell wall-associated hydrolase, NlpC family [Allokutzneria albata]
MNAKVGIAAAATILLIPILIAALLLGAISAVLTGGSAQPSANALADIPPDYLRLYHQAASTCPGLNWSILAAIGKIETDHGRSPLPGVTSGENHAGAGGPMQFLQASFTGVLARHALPPGGAAPPSRYNPHDAIHAAAHYLCDNGIRRGDLHKAIFAYNHADWYVKKILAQAQTYTSGSTGTGDCATVHAPNPVALSAITYACAQRGLPYVWGGNGPAGGHAGFDCSGLTTAAYRQAGIYLPRTAHTQFHAGPRVPDGEPLSPGDLVFYGNPHSKIRHVGLYLGSGMMINAPDFGQVVKIEPFRYPGDDYAGATRPAS